MELEELLETLAEQQKSLLLLADQQRELWANSLDTAFQQILRRHAGSISQAFNDYPLLQSNDLDQPFTEGGPSKLAIEPSKPLAGSPLRSVNPTAQPKLIEVDDDGPSQWAPLEAPKTAEPPVLVDLLPMHQTFSQAEDPVPVLQDRIEIDACEERSRQASDGVPSITNFRNTNLSSASPTSNRAFASIVNMSKDEEDTFAKKCFNFVMRYLDSVASLLVFLNALVMLLEFEMAGRRTGKLLGQLDGPYWNDHHNLFKGLGITFDCLFAIELLLRILHSGPAFVKDVANVFDSSLVIAGLAEHFLLLIIPDDPMGSQLMRALSSIRAVRMLRAFRFSQGLKLLLNACQAFLMSLVWSMVLLFVVMVVASLMIGNLLQDYLQDDAMNTEDRQFIWRFYGTAYRSWYTLYEVTFAGNWPTMARPVLDKVSHTFVIFFVLYITVIVFALIRVITAVFLKDTLDAANNDAELRMAEGLRKKAEYVEKLEGIFQAIDDGGDGMITEERLTYILDNPKVKAYFQTLDVDVHEGAALFHILDDGDGECTLEEFIGGILRCKGPARAIDQVAMMADLRQLDKKLTKLVQGLLDNNIIQSMETIEIPALDTSGETVKSMASVRSSGSQEGNLVSKQQSRRRASDAAQTFLYRTAMLPKLKHAPSGLLTSPDTTMVM